MVMTMSGVLMVRARRLRKARARSSALGTGLAVLALVAVTGCSSEGDTPTPNAGTTQAGGGSAQATSPEATAPTEGGATPSPSGVPSAATAPPTFATDPPGRQDSVLARLPGSKKAGCVSVGDERDVRSGSMAAGNFADARKGFAKDSKAAFTFYFIPATTAEDTTVSVTLARPDGSAAQTVESKNYETADVVRYYPAALTVPEDGTWRITATAGKDKGCWDVTFGG